MNRSILIVICDFLLVSLLAFSTVDVNEAVEQGAPRNLKLDFPTNQVDSRQDLVAVMRLALEDERRNRELLRSELSRARENLNQQERLSTQRAQEAQAYQQKLQAQEEQAAAAQTTAHGLQQQLAATAREARQLQDERTRLQQQVSLAQTNAQNLTRQLAATSQETRRLEDERTRLHQQVSLAQTNLLALSQQLQNRAAESQAATAKLNATENELRQLQNQATNLTRVVGQLGQSNQLTQAERNHLAERLRAAEEEKRAAAAQLARAFDELKAAREEQARLTQHAERLAENVKALASDSGALAREIRENRPLAANTVFEDYVGNRVHASFAASRPGLLGMETSRRRDAETVLVAEGTNLFALCHVDDTAMTLGSPGADWATLSGSLNRAGALFSVRGMCFAQADPRVVLVPVSPEQARQLGCKVYRLAPAPFKFQEAVLVGAKEAYYGECKFQIDLSTPRYVRMDRSIFLGLFGKFNPSRGDLVFSKGGEVLGLMVNSSYCVLLPSLKPSASLAFGPPAQRQRTGEILAREHARLAALPLKLQ
jgi:hypothetical protein